MLRLCYIVKSMAKIVLLESEINALIFLFVVAAIITCMLLSNIGKKKEWQERKQTGEHL